ncbi:MAG: NYN domain-containing protein [Candidatus Paceibacterota bacterium]
MSDKNTNNLAFIDGQNLYLGVKEKGWKIDYGKFRTYLKDKYDVQEAYYFMGYVSESEQDLYDNLQRAGFILSFREHSSALKGKKKGNVDSDLIFSVMKKIIQGVEFDNIILVSGDGDYKKLVDFLIKRDELAKILFPNLEFSSSLYKSLGSEYFDHLDKKDVRKKIEYRQ